jgi:hypothetical protein
MRANAGNLRQTPHTIIRAIAHWRARSSGW